MELSDRLTDEEVLFVARTEDALQREQYVRGVKTEVAIARTRAEVASLSSELVEGGFAGWGGGTSPPASRGQTSS